MKTRKLTTLFLIIYVLSVFTGCHSSTYAQQQQLGAESPQTLPTNNHTTESIEPTDPTDFTFPTEPTGSTSTTKPTEPDPTEPSFTDPEPKALTADEIAQLQEFYAYRDPNSENGPNYYNTALATGFNDRYYISFNYFFCNGDQTNWQETGMTEEEYAFIMSNVRDADLPGMKYYRITREDLSRIFYMCFGVTVEHSAQVELQWTPYWEKLTATIQQLIYLRGVCRNLQLSAARTWRMGR